MGKTETAKLLSRDDILAADDRPIERVPVPEWGGDVCVRSLSGAERDRWEQRFLKNAPRARPVKGNPYDNIRASLCALAICDESGKRLFTSEKDVEALGKKSAAALNRVFDVARRLNGLSDDDVEELAKNSRPGRSGGSTTA